MVEAAFSMDVGSREMSGKVWRREYVRPFGTEGHLLVAAQQTAPQQSALHLDSGGHFVEAEKLAAAITPGRAQTPLRCPTTTRTRRMFKILAEYADSPWRWPDRFWLLLACSLRETRR